MTSSISAKEQFDQQAAQYNQRWAGWSDETLQRLRELADPQPSWQVLDVATGTGFTALGFALLVAHVTGADISSGMLAQAEKRAREQNITNVSWVESPAEKLPFPDANFDLVTVRIAPHHFTNVPAFLRETYRVLKPGGLFVLGDTTVPDNDLEASAWQNTVEYERDRSHAENLSAEVWRHITESAGFTVTDLETLTGAIQMTLTPWLETSGTVGEQETKVRKLFAEAPESARRHFQIRTDDTGETHFAWQRVILRAIKR